MSHDAPCLGTDDLRDALIRSGNSYVRYTRDRAPTAALRQQRPFHEPARSAKLKITSLSLRSINAPPSLFLRSNCASTFHKVKHYSEPPPLTRRNAQSPPFALVVMPNAIVAQ